MTSSISRQVVVCRGPHGVVAPVDVVRERPLVLRLNERELITLMTDFSHPDELVVGFLYNEGLLDDAAQVQAVEIDRQAETAHVTAAIDPVRLAAAFGKRVVTSGANKGSLYHQVLRRVEEGQVRVRGDLVLPPATIYARCGKLSGASELYKNTHGVHGAALYDAEEVLVFREDIGRHNALDKLAGWALAKGRDPGRCALYFTGRISSEVMLKAGRLGVPILSSLSAPTDLGLALAEKIGMTVVGKVRADSCRIYTHSHRIAWEET